MQRHNALRDLLHWWLDVAGLKPEKEKPGLLLPHRPDDSVAERRPADIFLPTYAGSPTALDLAVTAPLRAESLTEASNTPAAAAASYAQVKRAHLDTAAVCARQGLSFKPLVLECTGAWEREAAKFLRTSQGPLLSGLDRTCPRFMASSCRSCVWLHAATAPELCFDGVLDWPLPRRRTFLCNLSPERCQPSESLLFLKGFLHTSMTCQTCSPCVSGARP